LRWVFCIHNINEMSYTELLERHRTNKFPKETKEMRDQLLMQEEKHFRFHNPTSDLFAYPNNGPPFRLNEVATQAHSTVRGREGILSGDIPTDWYLKTAANIQAYTSEIAKDNVLEAAGAANTYAAMQTRIKETEDAVDKLLKGDYGDELPEYVKVRGFSNWADVQKMQPTTPVTRESFQLVDHNGVSEFDKLFNDITYVSADVESARRKKVKTSPRPREQVMADIEKAKLQHDAREKALKQELARLSEQEFQNQQRRYF